MSNLQAEVFTGLIIDENEQFYFVQKDGQTMKLAKEEGSRTLGDAVEGFAYQNQKMDWRFTTNIPKVRKGHYSFAKVIDSRRDLGVFVDIGLSDKDVVISLDELPTMRELWPKKGDRVMISLRVDEKNRIWANLADEKIFKALSKYADDSMKNKDVTGTVYRLKMAGTYLLTDEYQIGFIHPNERFNEPRLGESIAGRVIGIRPDGVLNISVKPRAHEAISDDAQMIIAYLKRTPSKQMLYTDKSDPEDIKQMFGISKGQFKRALGSLMKQKLIKQEDSITYLISEPEDK